MSYDFKTLLLGLRLQYYLPFVLASGYIIWNPSPKTVQANQGSSSLPHIIDRDPSTWPQPAAVPEIPNALPPEPVAEKSTEQGPSAIRPLAEEPRPPVKIGDIVAPPPISPVENRRPIAPFLPVEIPVSPSPIISSDFQSNTPPALEPASPSPDVTSDTPTIIPATLDSAPVEIEAVEGSEEILGLDEVEPPEQGREAPPPQIPSIISPYQSDEYRLTIGDTISVFVANIPEFTTENILRSDGSINLPVAGEIYLWDMTLEEAGKAITKHYVDAKVLQKPDISVRLLASSPLKIAIAGQINRPGAYDVPVLDKKLPTITDVIRLAGGIGGEADLRNVEVYRHNRQGGQELLNLNLLALFQEADLSQNITLRSGDRVIIPNAPVRSEEAGLIAAANISPDAMQVGILGEVLSPGLVQAPTQTALNQALILAGGLNSRAKKSIQLVRTNEDGSVTREKIKIDWNASVGSERNPILKNRDVILVGQNAIARYTDFLDRAIAPINRTIPFIGILDLLFPGSTNSGR